MYVRKLEYLQQRFKQDCLYSGIIVKAVKPLPIGTPCIIDLNVSNSKKFAADLKRLSDENKIEDYFRNGIAPANLLFLFNANNEYSDIVISNNKVPRVCRTDDKPLIYDSYSSTLLDSSKESIIGYDILEQVKDQLKNNRFVNYVFENARSSNVNNIISSIEKIVRSLIKDYKNAVSFYYYAFTGARVLIDTVSVSFYEIKDVIPVFNYKKSEGICMEVMMTNSDIKDESIIKEGHSMTYKFLFAKYSENVFSIDGEAVRRPNDSNITDVLSSSYKLLKKFVPIDVNKNNSKPTITKGQKKVKVAISDSMGL